MYVHYTKKWPNGVPPIPQQQQQSRTTAAW